jgi:hypothetical protein
VREVIFWGNVQQMPKKAPDPPRNEDHDWYYAEIDKLGLVRTDAPAIFRDKGIFRECYLVPLPGSRTREQLEEIIAELKIRVGIEPGDP